MLRARPCVGSGILILRTGISRWAHARQRLGRAVCKHSALSERRIEELDSEGLARTTMTDLEIGYSARNADEWDRLIAALRAFRHIDVQDHHFVRAQQVQRELAAQGLKGRKVSDLVIAAVAEATSLTVVHYDADFDHIATVTGQPTQWIVDLGSID